MALYFSLDLWLRHCVPSLHRKMHSTQPQQIAEQLSWDRVFDLTALQFDVVVAGLRPHRKLIISNQLDLQIDSTL